MSGMRIARCACGQVELEAKGAPIASVVCYCDDCQEGSRRIEALPKAHPIRDAAGGTPYLHFRKDRVRVGKGADRLQDMRLKPNCSTRRVVTTCCDAPLFLDWEKGHWFSVYRAPFGADAPAVEMRMEAKFSPNPDAIPKDAPVHKRIPLRLVGRLLKARVAMMLGR